MIKINQEQKDRLKDVLAKNHLEKTNKKLLEIANEAGVSYSVAAYYNMKWGFAKKKGKSRSSTTGEATVSLKKAIAICKANGLKVTREKLVVEEL